ncbi:MAG: NFYB/HAP3 family transcription factor subunit [Candidatus Marsarchaeota archaeon]|nr:NFYB/HAP3 family transcription factor subunit [Candidatus Marsarchaeota archaeon]MCL5102174.1 NFYB/HAP3 family transcription factor subunit [Candidatus Marsarchaeota archaeon]
MGISVAAIKKLVNEKYGIKIDDEAAEAMAKMLDEKASEIAKYAVAHAKSSNSPKVTSEDIDAYKLNLGN